MPNWPYALWALPMALLVGLGLARWPLLSRWIAGIVAAYALGGRVDGLYMAPVALLTALAAGLELEALARGKWGRVFAVVGMLGFLALASQAAAQRRAVRLEVLARTRAKVEASPEGAQLLTYDVLNTHALGLKVSIKPCGPEEG